MPTAIPKITKSRVINQWFFQGLSRDAIAEDNKISGGAVTNIVDDSMDDFGRPDAESMRELAKSLRTQGITPAECASGYRVMRLLSGRGIEREKAENFVTDILKGCENMGITASKAITHIEDLLKFSDIVPLPHVQDYLNQRTAEKAQLERGIKETAVKKSALEKDVTEAQKSRDMILEEKRKDTEEMSSYLAAKQELGKHGISLNEDLTKFANTVKCIAHYGYNPKLVLAEFKNIGYLEDKLRALHTAVGEKEKKIAELYQSKDELDDRCNYLERVIKLNLEELPVYTDLANIGVGPKHLKVLYNLMVNITNSNDIPYWQAAEKFFEDIGTQYDAKLGFESKIERQKSEIQLLNDEREKHLKILKNQHLVGHVVTKLLQLDLTVDDILKMGQSYLILLKRTYSVEDLSKGMIKAIDMVTAPSSSTATTPTGTTKTSIDDKFTEILTKTRNELSELRFNNQPAA